ncbi:MAG TPA: molybdate ABC transporter substrate-binding protein [Thermomicrobiaceae bacterium]|nr:molybdate ABC transporter substrate-binding protein [Thermomicrobiaceae bacterium]
MRKPIPARWARFGRPRFRLPLWLALLVCLTLLAACGGAASNSAGDASPSAGGDSTLTVFAAASLTEAFNDLKPIFEQAHPGVTLRYNFAGSQELVAQIEQGAPADVFASADESHMDTLVKDGWVGQPQTFAHNRLVVITPADSPVQTLHDLAAGGIKLDVADASVPVGNYTLQMFDKLANDPAYGPDFKRQVLDRVVSKEDNVKAVVTKVSLGEVDAGVCYATDVTPSVRDKVRTIDVPDAYNVIASYPAAPVKASKQATLARAFVQLLVGSDGQKVLASHGFSPASP